MKISQKVLGGLLFFLTHTVVKQYYTTNNDSLFIRRSQLRPICVFSTIPMVITKWFLLFPTC